MLRIRNHIPKHLASPPLLSTLGQPIAYLDLRRHGLDASGRQGAPGVEFAVGPVCVGGPDGPAAEEGVCATYSRPGGEDGGVCGGELAVADVGPVGEGVVTRDKLVGAEVCGLEEAWMSHD